MQSKLKLDHPTRAVAMATGGAAIAAIAAMFVPTAFWETLTGATGVSEMIPATGAPLGDKARALISFTFGALTLAILTVMFLRKTAPVQHSTFAPAEIEPEWSEPEPEHFESTFELDEEKAERGSLFIRLRARIAAFIEARRGAGDITDLEDLPKLRSGDAHPDAPPRRPFSANRDLAEPEQVDVVTEATDVEQVEVEWVEPEAAEVEQIVPAAEIDTIAEDVVQSEAGAEEPPVSVDAPSIEAPARAPIAEIASLDEMVSRFESVLAERDTQLAHIENLATEIQSSNVQPIRRDIEAPVSPDPARAEVASLRSVDAADSATDVPQKPESEELDAALRSALETLHRMNARTR